jgi:hypothetical protein
LLLSSGDGSDVPEQRAKLTANNRTKEEPGFAAAASVVQYDRPFVLFFGAKTNDGAKPCR